MHVNWSKVASVGLRVVSAAISSASTIEQLSKAIPVLKGQAKADAAVALAQETLKTAEEVAGRDLLSDPAVEGAVRSFLDSYVALQNVLASRPAAQPGQ